MGKPGRMGTLVLWVAVCGVAPAQSAAAAGIYSCVNDAGNKLTSDRPIAECMAREQRVLNPDGSVKNVVPPSLTHEERTERDARERDAAVARSAQNDASRRDRNLMVRFPNEAAHAAARSTALDDVRKAMQLSERRLADLATERKPLIDETEFYVGKPLPAKLKQQMDANDAAVEAQRSLLGNQRIEEVRINANFDVELERLQNLWAGKPPGSMGVLRAAADKPTSVVQRTPANPASSSTVR